MTQSTRFGPLERTGGGDGGGGNSRTLHRRRALPGGRAVTGGFLVALAAVGIFAAYTDATADRRQSYVVARHDFALGHRLSRSDLSFLPMDLPAPLRARSFRDPSELVGAVVVGPVSEGELVEASDVVARSGTGVGRELSFAIESARAVDGRLQPGEFVDVLASYGTGSDAYTVAVMRGARIVARSQPRRALGEGTDEVVTLSVPNRADSLAVAHAVSAGSVTLVRSVEPPTPAEAADRATYRAPGAGPAAPPTPGR